MIVLKRSHKLSLLGSNGRFPEPEAPFFPCFRCGVCCTKYQVPLNLIEARRIADSLGLTWQEFFDKYTDRRWPGTCDFLLRQSSGGACVFLEHTEKGDKTTCLIHSFRPTACRDWTPSLYQRECQEGLAKYWGLTISSSGKLQGVAEAVPRFQSFLEVLFGFGCSSGILCPRLVGNRLSNQMQIVPFWNL